MGCFGLVLVVGFFIIIDPPIALVLLVVAG